MSSEQITSYAEEITRRSYERSMKLFGFFSATSFVNFQTLLNVVIKSQKTHNLRF